MFSEGVGVSPPLLFIFMKYVTFSDLSDTIRRNFHKIPHDIDFVIGIPRSGLIAGGMIAELLNVPLIDIDSFIFGAQPTGGNRLRYNQPSESKKKVLVVDDTIFNGGSMRKAKEKLKDKKAEFDFVFMVVYQEGKCTDVDLSLEDLRKYTNNYTQIVLYEWNILQHHNETMRYCLYDIDGVLCLDPPDERNTDTYQEYIRNATPLFIPKSEIGELVTYRLQSNRKATEDWLKKYDVKYKGLTMFPASSWSERNNTGISPASFKADIYRKREWAKLFVESNDAQARAIYMMTGKPVYCVSTNRMYQNQ